MKITYNVFIHRNLLNKFPTKKTLERLIFQAYLIEGKNNMLSDLLSKYNIRVIDTKIFSTLFNDLICGLYTFL